MSGARITSVLGPAIVLPGDDIDTDRIMPARFLKAVTFDGLEAHLFADDRRQMAERGQTHPFDDPARRHARVLIVGSNFGCGSSREHAPQGLARAGFRAMIGRSFSEIFPGNSAMLGVPCFVAGSAEIERLQSLVEATPEAMITVDVATGTVTAGSLRVEAALPPALRDGFLSGQWNPTAMLLQDFDEVRAVAERLPYIRGF